MSRGGGKFYGDTGVNDTNDTSGQVTRNTNPRIDFLSL